VAEFVKVASVGDVKPGQMKCVTLGRKRVGLANVDGEYLAFDDTCTHEEASLTEGELFGDVVECPLHGAAFNLRTGAVESFPATVPLPVYAVRIEGDEIQVASEPREQS
jgi:3-phenylpropionate/trans-cinnamate dioxygenase ferredoxin subunit